MGDSTYRILASFAGTNAVVAGYRQMREEQKATTRSAVEGGRAEVRAAREAERARKEAAREGVRAQREAARETARLRAQELQQQRAHVRQMQRAQQELRDERSRALKVGGAGAVGLAGLGAGVRVAGDFEASVTEMRLAIQRLGEGGSVDMALLNSQMERLEELATRLGNMLPGTTQAFVEGLVALKQGGLETELILKGAGEAAAYLAVVTKNNPGLLGKGYAQLGQAFQLKPEEFVPSADFFAKLYRTAGIDPLSLIEGAKFFAPRAGLPLGLTGMKGLRGAGELLGGLRRSGLEEGIGGRELSMLMSRLIFDKKPQLKALETLRARGIKLEFFDKKGEFKGVDNLVAQLEKLKKLSQEERMSVLGKLFTEESKGAAEVLIRLGTTGLRAFRADLEAVPPLQQQIGELQKDFNQKLEATLGTAQNVVARAFLPMLDVLKPALDSANKGLGNLEWFFRQHQTVAQYAGSVAGIGSAALVAYGGIRTFTTGVKLWQVATRIANAENRLLRASLYQTGGASQAAAAQFAASSRRMEGSARGMGKRIGGMLGTALKTTLVGLAIETVISDIFDRGMREIESRKASAEIADLRKQRSDVEAGMRGAKIPMGEGQEKIRELDKQIGEKLVEKTGAISAAGYLSSGSEFATQLASITRGPLMAALRGERGYQSLLTPGLIQTLFETGGRPGKAQKFINEQIPSFSSAGQLGAFLEAVKKSGVYDQAQLSVLSQLVTTKYPQYMQELGQATSETRTLTEAFRGLAGELSLFRPLYSERPDTGFGPKARLPFRKPEAKPDIMDRYKFTSPSMPRSFAMPMAPPRATSVQVTNSPTLTIRTDVTRNILSVVEQKLDEQKRGILTYIDDKMRDKQLGM